MSVLFPRFFILFILFILLTSTNSQSALKLDYNLFEAEFDQYDTKMKTYSKKFKASKAFRLEIEHAYNTNCRLYINDEWEDTRAGYEKIRKSIESKREAAEVNNTRNRVRIDELDIKRKEIENKYSGRDKVNNSAYINSMITLYINPMRRVIDSGYKVISEYDKYFRRIKSHYLNYREIMPECMEG